MDRFQVAEGYSVTAARAHVICMAILSLCLYWYWIARFKIRTRQHCVLHAYLLQDNTKWTWIKNIKCSRIYMWGTWRTQFHLRSAQLISKPVTLFAIISQSMSQWTQVRSSFLTRRLIANIWTSCIVFEQFLQPGLVHVQVWSIGTPGGDSCDWHSGWRFMHVRGNREYAFSIPKAWPVSAFQPLESHSD